jgi:hypothetical protein
VDGKESFTFGTLGAGQEACHMNPPWKIPSQIDVTGSREGQGGFQLAVNVQGQSNAPEKILIIIQEKEGKIEFDVTYE